MSKLIRPICIEGNLAYVSLTQGYEAVIDADDVPLVEGWNWFAEVAKRSDGTVRSVYALHNYPCSDGKQRRVRMHRAITAARDGIEVDHRDGDGLNNRRHNMRFATKKQNQHNMRTPCHNTSGIKGVSLHKASRQWLACIRLNKKRHYLGYFATITDAAAAYAKASAELHGEFGRTS